MGLDLSISLLVLSANTKSKVFFSCRTESAAALEKTFGGKGYVRAFSKFLSTKALRSSASTDLVACMLPACCQHVASMLPASTCRAMLPTYCQHIQSNVANMLPACAEHMQSMSRACAEY